MNYESSEISKYVFIDRSQMKLIADFWDDEQRLIDDRIEMIRKRQKMLLIFC